MARSYIKISGPSLLKGFQALEKIAVQLSKETAMRFYSAMTPQMPFDALGETEAEDIHILPGFVEMPTAEKVKLISKSSRMLGDYDFFFEWGV